MRQLHDYLMQHLDRRITTAALARQYRMNTTTLKTLFKQMYGTSLAAHIKRHRMEKAARLLTETDQSVGAVARAVGYENQSKFTAAFKGHYGLPPREYRRQVRAAEGGHDREGENRDEN